MKKRKQWTKSDAAKKERNDPVVEVLGAREFDEAMAHSAEAI